MFLSTLFGRLAVGRRRRLAILELDALPERRLDDLGLSRFDLLEAARRR